MSVLAGALLVGESVRASLRGLVDERLGRTAIAVTGQGFFRQVLGDEIRKTDGFSAQFADAATLIAIEASVTHEQSGREASRIQVYGIDASFFRLHGVTGVEAPTGRQALLSPGLAAELGAAARRWAACCGCRSRRRSRPTRWRGAATTPHARCA